MAITIDATVGGASTNSNVTEAEAIAVAAITPNLVGWTTVTGSTCSEDEKKWLIAATDWLRTLGYQGYRVTDTQAQPWPRDGAPNPEGTSSTTVFETTVIPNGVKRGTCALAFACGRAGTTDILTLGSTAGVVEETVGPLTTRYADPSQRAQGLAQFPEVMRWINPLLAIVSGQVRLVR